MFCHKDSVRQILVCVFVCLCLSLSLSLSLSPPLFLSFSLSLLFFFLVLIKNLVMQIFFQSNLMLADEKKKKTDKKANFLDPIW